MRNRFFWSSTIEVVNFPKFDSIKLCREMFLNQGSMLGLLYSNNVVGSIKVLLCRLQGKSLVGINWNVVVCQTFDRGLKHESWMDVEKSRSS